MLTQSSADPLLDEVRQRRRDLYTRYGNDLNKVAQAIRELQSQHPEKVLNRAKRLHVLRDRASQ
jgi:hypothetical protein